MGGWATFGKGVPSARLSAKDLAGETEADEEMRLYIKDMLPGLSAMAAEASLHDLSALLRVATREADPRPDASPDATALRTALRE